MRTKDEKEWLRAVLEGKVKPGDAGWQRIWQTEDFAEVRKVLLEVGRMEQGEVVFDREKMWRILEECRREERKQRQRAMAWRWVAAVMLPLLMGGMIWFLLKEKKEMPAVSVAALEAGHSQAVLILAKGERIDLTSVRTDTLLGQGRVHVLRDSVWGVMYERCEERAVYLPCHLKFWVERSAWY